MTDGLRFELVKELDHLLRMMPIWSKAVTRTKAQYDMSKTSEDFVLFLEAHYKVVYMKDKMGWITRVLTENPDE